MIALVLKSFVQFDSPAYFSPFFFFQPVHLFQYENLTGSAYSVSEHHTVNLMIASGTPLDFTMGFYKRQTTAVLLFS